MQQRNSLRGCENDELTMIETLRCLALSLSSSLSWFLSFASTLLHRLTLVSICAVYLFFFFFFSVPASHLCTCLQGNARSGWKLFRRPRAPPPAAPRRAPTASRAPPPQTSEACWSSAVTKAECWCPWRGVKSGSAKQNRYFQNRRDFLSTERQLPV